MGEFVTTSQHRPCSRNRSPWKHDYLRLLEKGFNLWLEEKLEKRNPYRQTKRHKSGLVQRCDICLRSVRINNFYLPLALSQEVLKPLWSLLQARRQQEVLFTLLDRSKVPFFCGTDIPAKRPLFQGDMSWYWADSYRFIGTSEKLIDDRNILTLHGVKGKVSGSWKAAGPWQLTCFIAPLANVYRGDQTTPGHFRAVLSSDKICIGMQLKILLKHIPAKCLEHIYFGKLDSDISHPLCDCSCGLHFFF